MSIVLHPATYRRAPLGQLVREWQARGYTLRNCGGHIEARRSVVVPIRRSVVDQIFEFGERV